MSAVPLIFRGMQGTCMVCHTYGRIDPGQIHGRAAWLCPECLAAVDLPAATDEEETDRHGADDTSTDR